MDKEHVKGAADKVVGKSKEVAGRVTGGSGGVVFFWAAGARGRLAKKSMACCRVPMPASTDLGSIPKRAAVPVIRLFCRSLGGRESEVEVKATGSGVWMLGLSVRGLVRVKTYSRVGACAIRKLGSILSEGIASQSRRVARIEVWSSSVFVFERNTVPASIQGDTRIVGTRTPNRSK